MSRSTPIVIQLKKRSGPGPAPPATDDPDDGGAGYSSEKDTAQQPYNPLGETSASMRQQSPEPPSPSPERVKEAAPPRAPSEPPPSPADEQEESSAPAKGSTKETPPAPAGPVLGSFANTVSLLDVMALADLFRTFHGEVDTFVRQESEKLFEQEARNQQARRGFQEAYDLVRGFLDEFAPEDGLPDPEDVPDSDADEKGAQPDSDDASGDGDEEDGEKATKGRERGQRKGKAAAPAKQESERDTLSKRLLPQFVRFVTDDQRAMQDANELLGTFVQRHFRANKELAALLDKPAPVTLFRSLLRVLVAELGLGRSDKRGAGKKGTEKDRDDRKERDGSADRGERGDDRDRREAGQSRKRRSRSDRSSPASRRGGSRGGSHDSRGKERRGREARGGGREERREERTERSRSRGGRGGRSRSRGRAGGRRGSRSREARR